MPYPNIWLYMEFFGWYSVVAKEQNGHPIHVSWFISQVSGAKATYAVH